MTTHHAGQIVGSGLYVSFRDWDLQIVSNDGEQLEGEGGHGYHRIPLLMLVLLSPAIGGIYAAAFPAVIFAAFARVLRDHFKGYRLFDTGEVVRWGVYVGLNRLCVSYVSADDERLDGDAGTRFLRVPTWLVVVGSPLIGGLYVVLFPFLLAAALLTVLVGLVAAPFSRASEDVGRLATSHWEPSAAYLEHPEQDAAEPSMQADNPLSDLEAEIAARRAAESKDDDRSAS